MKTSKNAEENFIELFIKIIILGDLLNEPWLAVFVNQPNVVVEEGASVELECSAEATPVAVIHWLFNGKRITVGSHENELNIVEKVNNEGIRTLQDSITRSKLRIGCVNKNTVGRYECVAVNGYLTESANATIKMVKECKLLGLIFFSFSVSTVYSSKQQRAVRLYSKTIR